MNQIKIKATAIELEGDYLRILNQQQLPGKIVWLEVHSVEDMVRYIKELNVRGAPLIGIAASLFLALFARREPDLVKVSEAKDVLLGARPTAINLKICLERVYFQIKQLGSQAGFNCAIELFKEDQEMCSRMGVYGAELIMPGDGCLTCCNTGGLATVGQGTALSVLKTAYDQGKDLHIFVIETRPLLQGARLTTWECEQQKIPYTLLCDNMAGSLMAKGKIQKIFVGADRIAKNGDFANKIGTYSLAVLAKFHKIPFYCVAPYTTIDNRSATGMDIPIEMRSATEVTDVSFHSGSVTWAPQSAAVYNPSFDITPHSLVSGYVLEKGVFSVEEFQKLKWGHQKCGQ